MRLLNCNIKNFGSYKDLSFDFTDIGLALVYGPTGSGKSTLEDIATWILYGKTSKNGAVDDIVSWDSNSEPTTGIITLQLASNKLMITRIRGKSNENDLYWQEDSSENKIRGKDLSDTQKLLEKRLGVSTDLYRTAACFNEFSDSGLFFLAKGKDKRELFEKIANLTLPAILAEKSSAIKKDKKKQFETAQRSNISVHAKIEQLKNTKESLEQDALLWEKEQTTLVENLKSKSRSFEKDKDCIIEALSTKSYRFDVDKSKRLEELTDRLDELSQQLKPVQYYTASIEDYKRNAKDITCPTCKRAGPTQDRLDALYSEKLKNDQLVNKFKDYSKKILEVQGSENPFTEQFENAKKSENHYLAQIKTESKKQNPFFKQLENIKQQLEVSQKTYDTYTNELSSLMSEISTLEQLYDLSFDLRGVLLTKAIKSIQDMTNEYLDTYFDSELRVSFELEKSDSVETIIQKGSNVCNYSQLSKGQRQLLKLCFSVSIMKSAANNAGIHFDNLFMDESLDGLDTNLKLKAFRLFENLSLDHASVLVIDHCEELHTLFNKKYKVMLEEDHSTIEIQV